MQTLDFTKHKRVKQVSPMILHSAEEECYDPCHVHCFHNLHFHPHLIPTCHKGGPYQASVGPLVLSMVAQDAAAWIPSIKSPTVYQRPKQQPYLHCPYPML